MGLRTKKSLGQHFLLNPSTIDKILEKAQVGPNDRILEIGPGRGVMTRKLAERAGKVVAVEKDRRLAPLLQAELKPFSNFSVIEGDILEQNLERLLDGGRWKVVANLPYNIATEVIFFLFKSSFLFESFYLMFQKEVADRITAGPGGKDYGILSVFSQLISENKIVMRLPPGAFTPPPKVDSALVEFKIQEALRFDIRDFPLFEKVVQGAFSQRRKMILNSLKGSLKDFPKDKIIEALKSANIEPTDRAEQVPIEQFAMLANRLAPMNDF